MTISWQFTILTALNLLTAVAASIVARVSWRRRFVPGARALSSVMAAVALWALADAVGNMALTLETRLAAAKVSHIGVQLTAVLFLIFCARYTRRDRWLTLFWLAALFVVPMITLVMVFTNELHYLVWTDIRLVNLPMGVEDEFVYGPWFWVAAAYNYLLIACGSILLVQSIFHYRDIYRRQFLIIVSAVSVPWIANIAFLMGRTPFPGLDWTPFAFTLSGALLAWAIFYWRLFDLAPVARSLVLESIGDAVIVLDGQQRIVDANPAAASLLAVPGQKLVGVSLKALLDDAQLIATLTGTGYKKQVVISRDTGDQRTLQATVTPLIDNIGRPIGRLVVLHDISELKHAEQELRASERRYRGLVEKAPFPSIVTTADGSRCLYLNQRAAELLDTKVSMVIGRAIEEFFDDAEAGAALYARMAEDGAVNDHEICIRTSQGRRIWVSVTAVPIQFQQEPAVFASLVDVTHHRLAEQVLREARDTAEAATRAKSEFLATVSHELRTPLTSILGLTEVLQADIYGTLNQRQAHALRVIEESGRQLLTLINDILDLSKIEVGKLHLNLDHCLVSHLCEASLDDVRRLAMQKRHRLHSEWTPADLEIWGDRRRIRQMLVNLLDNAIKFTPDGGDIGIAVITDAQRGAVDITVWDTGIGIAASDCHRLFRPFVQLDAGLTRHHGGAGLGLALVRRLAEIHGGSVAISSQEGQGSRFTVTLPWWPPAGESEQGEREATLDRMVAENVSWARRDGTVAQPATVLLATNTPITASILRAGLAARGHSVLDAATGPALLRQLQEQNVDLILFDVDLLGADGPGSVHWLRTSLAADGMEDAGRLPLIALTSLALTEERDQCRAAGADDCFAKPASIALLCERIEALFEERCRA
ncbi:MAG: PAS domain S-box protein [Caldilineaceae bacterium]|nr:PAS domain S-box protein [Caldilineaceae bacterium]